MYFLPFQTPVSRRLVRQKNDASHALNHSYTTSPMTTALRRSTLTSENAASLDKIVTEYLRKQHAACQNPVVTCPPFSLLRCSRLLNRDVTSFCSKLYCIVHTMCVTKKRQLHRIKHRMLIGFCSFAGHTCAPIPGARLAHLPTLQPGLSAKRFDSILVACSVTLKWTYLDSQAMEYC